MSSDSQALLQSLQRGAKHFLTQPVTLEDLVSALRRSLNEAPTTSDRTGVRSQAVPKTAGQIVSVLGSRGGVGCTPASRPGRLR